MLDTVKKELTKLHEIEGDDYQERPEWDWIKKSSNNNNGNDQDLDNFLKSYNYTPTNDRSNNDERIKSPNEVFSQGL